MQNEDLSSLRQKFEADFASCDDFAIREINGGFICFIKNTCDREYISEQVVKPLVRLDPSGFKGDFSCVLQSAAFTVCKSYADGARAILAGNVFAAIQSGATGEASETDKSGGSDKSGEASETADSGKPCVTDKTGEKCGLYAVTVPADRFDMRSVSEPNSDVTVKGPRAGFNENGETSVASLRRIIRSSALKVLPVTVGSLTKTRVFLCYVEGRAGMPLVNDIKNRLETASASCVVDSANLEQLLCGRSSPFFPVTGSTEKVDKVASKLLAGRIALICDGSPFVLTLPYVFAESIQSAEDYLKSPYYASFMRVLRFCSFLVSFLLPAIFTAAMYHQRFVIPSALMESLEKLEEDISVPFIVEILVMLVVFEAIREVGVRMPRTVGDSVGIVASFILGDAVVQAGIAGTAVLLVVALSAVCSFIVPSLANVTVLLRFVFVFAAYVAGVYGILLLFGLTVLLLCRKKSFGAPYLSPLFPLNPEGLQDFLVAIPQKTLGRKEKL